MKTICLSVLALACRKAWLALTLLLLTLPLPSPLAAQSSTTTYSVLFKLGEHKIPGTLQLFSINDAYHGKMKVELPTPLNISLKERKADGGQVVMDASSPVTVVVVKFNDANDSISGSLHLTRNRTFHYKGKKEGNKVDEALVNSFLEAEPWMESEWWGMAFPTLNPNQDMLVYSIYRNDFTYQTLKYRTYKDGEWSVRQVLPFSGEHSDRSPMFDPTGKYLYFSSRRPVDGQEKADYDIWYATIDENGEWSEPQHVKGINSPGNDYQPCMTNRGLYFASDRQDGEGGQDIYFARGSAGKFETPVNLGQSINTKSSEMSAFVTADEKIMILATGNKDLALHGNDDLVLYEKIDGQWKFVKNLGEEINSFANEYGAMLSRDGKWLYYGSDLVPHGRVYRVEW